MSDQMKDIEIIFPRNFDLKQFIQMEAEEPFSMNAISFLDALATILRNDLRSIHFPEIYTFAFFCRKANLAMLKRTYYPCDRSRLGRGIAFHITPSNMAMNFAYSLVSGLLSGNLNIVRLPSQKFQQINVICNAIQTLSEKQEFKLFTRRILLVKYPKLNSATSYFSSICDARIIWGGDKAVEEIKRNIIPPKAIDITFADKYSLCVINADVLIKENSPKNIAQLFYNDTFLFDQNACTSPHLVVWVGSEENISSYKKIFWDNLHHLVIEKYVLQPYSTIDKLLTFYNQLIHLNGIIKTTTPDNLIWRVELTELTEDVTKYRCNCGYFVEYTASSITDLLPMISKKYQTIGSYGIAKEEWDQISLQKNLIVSERIKPLGKTSEFSFNWDGHNLINELSVPLQLDN